ncbi:hypothetical protein PCC9214_05392 (plasmid) [Planktothrix tepida]|uniref:Uncharacterized protein n=1 Tax=Planktothrix tepida PCC 9214 TaxID=671072 RepID=A0A1J1LN41_9CYAN|nr:hypothetical protein [Planktothrix tepida]CAD5988481.1 hypothetical protein PCC9214_05392 [Planktothrix tepida]CUR33907.1 hypothetical protein PL921460016 [Planktothrix tepida PCC 9214]
MPDKILSEIIENVLALLRIARNELTSSNWKESDFANAQDRKNIQKIKTASNIFLQELRYIEESIYARYYKKVCNARSKGNIDFNLIEEMSWLDLYKAVYEENKILQRENDQLKKELRQLKGEEPISHPVDELLKAKTPNIRMPSARRYEQLCLIYDELARYGVKILSAEQSIITYFPLEKNGDHSAALYLYDQERKMGYKSGWVIEPLDPEQKELTGEWEGYTLARITGMIKWSREFSIL